MTSLLRLRILLRPYIKQIALSLTLLLILTGLSLTIPTIIRQVIDVGITRGEVGFMLQMAMLILVIGLARSVCGYFQRYTNEWLAQHIAYDLRNRLYDHIQRLPFTFHDHSQTGQLISRCIEDVRSIQAFTSNGVTELFRMGLLMVGITLLLFTTSPRLALIAMLPMIPLILMTSSFGRRIGKLFLAVDNSLGEVSSRLQENVVGAQVVRAFARENYENERFNQANHVLFNAYIKARGEWSKVMPTSSLLVTIGTILILWFGGMMVIQGSMTIGEVVAFNSYLLMLGGPAQQLTWLVNLGGEAVAGVQRTFEILDLVPSIQTPPAAISLPALSGQVEYKHVSFLYSGETARALNDINVSVQPNQLIALIGPTGSGKTSLVNLIPRFYDVSEGAVLVDGIDVRKVDLVSLRKQIGIVLQTSLLFSATIRENIAYGRPDAGEEEIITAARAAQAHDFILELPDGYNTIVGERGITLSGGQRQRVAIARALLMDPRILILDDSTSSVDTQTEHLIQQALDRLMEGRTTFVIAHRLSTVKRADLILVMDDGRIVERGTHYELLHQDGRGPGLYKQIYELQLRDQEQFREEMEALDEIPGRKEAVTQQSSSGME